MVRGEERESGGGGGRSASGGGAETGSGDTLFLYKGDRREYCDKFAVNYEYYCRGDSDNPEITAKFCPSYKNACRDRLEG
ncbi:unnamed protein product [Heligmosomoides polygyrus]|uniref:BPTI/Kunitz inhibitor domain-containing protein n=1 Tax=Heligmosomoides polygyrus TaxID=6339 RepID=A0A183G363_HELPZ|nr:unnamed protein product [Heligmosomoides polygyrus]